jgi:hypothetical protein
MVHGIANIRSQSSLGFAAAAILVVMGFDGLRMAALVALVAGAVLLTRFRFAEHAALALTIGAAFLALTGHIVSGDDRGRFANPIKADSQQAQGPDAKPKASRP